MIPLDYVTAKYDFKAYLDGLDSKGWECKSFRAELWSWSPSIQMSDVPAPASLWPACCFRPGPRCKHSPGLCMAPPPQEASPVWPLCIPKHAYPMATEWCGALQRRANISQGPGGSRKTSEGGLMFVAWFGGSWLNGSGRMWWICTGSSCAAVPKLCCSEHFVFVRPLFGAWDELLSTEMFTDCFRSKIEHECYLLAVYSFFFSGLFSDKVCEGEFQGEWKGMGASRLHRSFIGGGTARLWEDWRPYSWSVEDLHAGEELVQHEIC